MLNEKKQDGAPKRKMGRPSSYTERAAQELCEWIAGGGSLRNWCERPGNPDQRTVRRWLREREEFRLQYARAREDQADAFVDQIVNIADSAQDANLARVQIDARKWAAGKLRPKVYGDKAAIEFGDKTLNAAGSWIDNIARLSKLAAQEALQNHRAEPRDS